MNDDPRARNNERFAAIMREREEAQADQRGPSPMRAAFGAWKLLDEARRKVPAILLPVASESASDAFQQAVAAIDKVITEGCLNRALINTSGAHNALQRHAEAASGHQDAKGARRAHTQSHVENNSSRVTNTGERPRCGQDGFECGWCHYCRQKARLACKPDCHQCAMKAVDEADAKAHPDEAGAILTHPADVNKGKKKIERVRGFQI